MSYWTPARIQELRDLWAAGMSGAKISKLWKTTRGRIMGKLWRLGLTRSTTTHTVTVRKTTKGSPPRPAQSTPVTERQTALPGGVAGVQAGKSFDELGPRDCRWIEGDPRDPSEPRPFCGQPRRAGSSYCEAHARRATTKNAPARPHEWAPLPKRRLRIAIKEHDWG